LTPDGFSRALPKTTKQNLGVALRPHAFRHIAATSIAEGDPEHVGIIRDILGHATLQMAEKHYNRAQQIDSARRYGVVLEELKKKLS
jgi:integrase